MRHSLKLTGWIVASFLTVGCAATPPPDTTPDMEEEYGVEVPETFVEADDTTSGPVDDGWLASFGDEQLVALVDEALEQNLRLQAAAAQVDVAAGLARQAGAQLVPAVGLVAGDSFTGNFDTETSPARSSGVALDVSWELDIWGRVRSQASGAAAQYEGAAYDFEYARQSLAAQVAKSWFQLTEARQQLALAEQNRDIKARTLELVEARFGQGRGSRQDIALARADLATAEDGYRQADGALRQSARALESLLGRYPSAEIEAPRDFVPLPPAVPAGLPSELLYRRPDLRAAERRVAAAFQFESSARAARFPTIGLSTSIGASSDDLNQLAEGTNPFWSGGANLIAPLFDGGLREAEVEINSAEKEGALAEFGAAALQAFGEVESSLDNERLLGQREELVQISVDENAEAARLAQIQYDVGAVDLLSVLQMQARELGARATLIRLQSARLLQRVNLHLALGGSFEEPGPGGSQPDSSGGPRW